MVKNHFLSSWLGNISHHSIFGVPSNEWGMDSTWIWWWFSGSILMKSLQFVECIKQTKS